MSAANIGARAVLTFFFCEGKMAVLPVQKGSSLTNNGVTYPLRI
jgi:hypothetical protein